MHRRIALDVCGVVGIVGHSSVNLSLYEALIALQHRGQDAAGIVTVHDNQFAMRKGNGLVSQVFTQNHMQTLQGNAGIGHVRYPTAGSSSSAEAQPLYVNSPHGVCLAHNGNLTNFEELRRWLTGSASRHLNTSSDSELLLNVLASELHHRRSPGVEPETIFDAVANVHKHCRGAYAVVALISGGGLLGFRDPRGIRPLIIGHKESPQGEDYMLASESAALDLLGYSPLRDVAPGEAVYITLDGSLHVQSCAEESELNPCIFEHVYFARPDSIMDEVSVYKARLRMGEYLAEKVLAEFPNGHDIDAVIPIPETSRTSALPVAHKLDVKYREGFVKNRYIGRTFIMPGQGMRERSVRRKLNAINLEFRGKNVLLIEDSVVRGTTTMEIVQQARNAGAKKVYVAVAAPPVRFPNVFGIDMPCMDEFIAHGRSIEQIARIMDVDRLIYQDLADLVESAREGNEAIEQFECSVFNGKYQNEDVDLQYLEKLSAVRNDETKILRDHELNGLGTNLELHNIS